MVSRRRSTLWMPFSEGASTTAIAAGAVSRLILPSIREAEVGREYEGYTVTRILCTWSASIASGGNVVYTCGIIRQNEAVAVGQIDPVANPSADWMWHEEFNLISTGGFGQGPDNLTRDLGSQRKVQGGESEVFWYIVNRGGVTITVHRAGRMLVKRA